MIPVSWCRVPSSASWLCCGNAGRHAADLHGCMCLDTRRMRVQVHVPAGHPQDPADYAPPELRSPGLTVVLVHGAFADASSWNGVVERLQAAGVQVTAPPNPLR